MNTEIELSIAALKAVLPGLGKIVPRTVTLPILGYVRVMRAADQSVRLQVTNLDETATVLVGQSAGAPGELLVPYAELVSMHKNCAANETIRLVASDTETKVVFWVAGQQVERQVAHADCKEWPPVIDPTSEPLTLDESFKQALKEALECVSSDQSRYILQGACLDITKKEAHYVVGTDGRHLYAANSFLFDIPVSLVIPARRFLSWPGFLVDGPWTLRFDPPANPPVEGKTAVFRLDSDHWSYQAKPIEGDYPNWKQVVPEANGKTTVQLSTAAVEAILDALPLLPGMDSPYQSVTLEALNPGFRLKAIAKGQAQWTQIPIADVTVIGGPSSVALDRRFLSKALRFGLNTIDITDELSPIVLSCKGKKFVAMPLRASAPGKPKEEVSAPEVPAPPLEASTPEVPAPAEPTPAPVAALPTEASQPTEPVNRMSEPTLTAPQRGNLTSHDGESKSGIKELIERVEGIKTSLRGTIGDLNDLLPALREVIREQKATDKEIASVRTTLRSLQSVKF